MSEEALPGYRGELREGLVAAGASIGDVLELESNGRSYEGVLMPRVETADDWHIVIKLDSGYNIGVTFDESTSIRRLGVAERPEFRPPPLPEMRSDLPKVSIVSTGGTIASRVDYITGGVYAAMSSRDLLSIVPELADIARVDADILYSVFSENIRAEHWSGIANRVVDKIEEGAQGVVVTHGTDTMAYSAAALSFILQDLPVPVIFVGSQRSSDRPSSDAATNLLGVVRAAAEAPFAGVVVGMHETTSDDSIIFHRGTKARKLHTSARYAFDSVNKSPIARVKREEVEILTDDFNRRSDSEPSIHDGFEEKVTLVKFHPGFNPDVLDWYLDEGYRGIILEGTGLGHVSETCYQPLRRAKEEDVFVGMTSQCIFGRVNMNVYSTGRDLQSLGVVPLGDMLPETAYIKLMWSLGQADDIEGAKDLMMKNIAGEYTERTVYGEGGN